MRANHSLAIVGLLVSCSAVAGITEAGRGMLFGANHVFAVTAKPGWVLDNQSAVSQGLHMVFYPKGKTWANSPVIIYGQTVPTTQAAAIQLQVEQTVGKFRGNGSPNYFSEIKPPLVLPGARKAEIYHYAGDQWGNYEAAAYIQETDTINFLVFSAKTKAGFEKYISDFRKIVGTYQNLYTAPGTLPTAKEDNLKVESTVALTKPGGNEYESKAIRVVGENLGSAMRDCTSNLREKQLSTFNYFVRIDRDGGSNESYVFPTNALSACFKGLMSSVKYPTHQFGSFVLNIKMKVEP